MLAKNICLALLGFSAGITAAGGLFSFIIGLGVIFGLCRPDTYRRTGYVI